MAWAIIWCFLNLVFPSQGGTPAERSAWPGFALFFLAGGLLAGAAYAAARRWSARRWPSQQARRSEFRTRIDAGAHGFVIVGVPSGLVTMDLVVFLLFGLIGFITAVGLPGRPPGEPVRQLD